jgi:hypothetical protein
MNIGKNIAYGIGLYAAIGFAIGMGIFMAIMMSEDTDEFETFFIAFFSVIIFLGSGPILGSFIGIFQGVLSREKPAHAAGAGFIAGPVGYVIAAGIIFMLMIAAISIKYPSDDEDSDFDDEEEEVQDPGPFFRMVAQILIPISLCCGLGAFISAKGLSDGQSLSSDKIDRKRLTPTGIEQIVPPRPAPPSQQAYQYPPQQYQSQVSMMNCPYCQKPTSSGNPNCSNCGMRIR